MNGRKKNSTLLITIIVLSSLGPFKVNFLSKAGQEEEINYTGSTLTPYRTLSSKSYLPNTEDTQQNILESNYDMSTNNLGDIDVDFDETLSNYTPELNSIGYYKNANINGSIESSSNSISLYENGNYTFNGNISDLEALLLENADAETDEPFYSENVNQAGIELIRLYDQTNIDGNYSWKFYSNNTSSLKYSLYQKDLLLPGGDIIISYDYKAESNSTLKNIVNSSVAFDFTFDTCRIVVYNWLYDDPPGSMLGENDTSGFPILYSFLYNTSWNDQWNRFSINISQFFSNDDPNTPTTLEGVGIFVSSPQYSESSFFLDNLNIRTYPSPEQLDLHFNSAKITSKEKNMGNFSLIETNPNNLYAFSFYHNSSFLVKGFYELIITGEVVLPFEKELILVPENQITIKLSQSKLINNFQSINITYPLNWNFYALESNNDIILVGLTSDTKWIVLSNNPEENINLGFSIENAILDFDYNTDQIFERITGQILVNQSLVIKSLHLFWFGSVVGGKTIDLENNTINFLFENNLDKGIFNISLLYLYDNIIGYFSHNFTIVRYPADLFLPEYITLPQYSTRVINISYYSLVEDSLIISPKFFVEIEEGEILTYENLTDLALPISSFYLKPGYHRILIQVNSSSHASVQKSILVFIYESEINVDLSYVILNYTVVRLEFNLTSGSFPVAYAPLSVYIDEKEIISGISTISGNFLEEVTLSMQTSLLAIKCNVLKGSHILHTASFEISIEALNVDIKKMNYEIITGKNLTLEYELLYPAENEFWFLPLKTEMLPILDAYIETDSLKIPIQWNEDVLYWQISANSSTKTHVLKVKTHGLEILTEIEKSSESISIRLILSSNEKNYNNFTLLYPLNETIKSSQYNWKILDNNGVDLSEIYEFEINSLYLNIRNLKLMSHSFLVLTVVGTQERQNKVNLWIPIMSGFLLLAGGLIFGIRIYRKKKSMIIEI